MGFATALRRAGLAVTADRTSAFVQAVALAGFDDRAATYWSGRATLCSSLDDNELYDRAFTAWFDGSVDEVRPAGSTPAPRQPQALLDGRVGGAATPAPTSWSPRGPAPPRCCVIATWPGSASRTGPGWRCSSTASMCVPPLRRALRRRPQRRGPVDLRRTLRAQLRTAGELTACAAAGPAYAPGGSCC